MAVPAVNFRIDALELPRGEKARFNANVEAIRTVKRIIAENRQATAEEQKTLSLYVGWGGIANAFDESKSAWKKEYNIYKAPLYHYESGEEMATDKRPTMLRLPETLYEKLRYLSYLEHRSINAEIEHALSFYISHFEDQNGPLSLPPAPSKSNDHRRVLAYSHLLRLLPNLCHQLLRQAQRCLLRIPSWHCVASFSSVQNVVFC